jgi:hypothetical protein
VTQDALSTLQSMQHDWMLATEHAQRQQDLTRHLKTSSAQHYSKSAAQHRLLLLHSMLLPSQPAAHSKQLHRLVGKNCSSLRWKHATHDLLAHRYLITTETSQQQLKRLVRYICTLGCEARKI